MKFSDLKIRRKSPDDSTHYASETTIKHYWRLHGTLVVIPALNEADSIAHIVEEIISAGPYDVLVVDDNSVDATAVLAMGAGAHVIRMPHHLGSWRATQTGIKYAKRLGYDVVITLDADGQHKPADIVKLTSALASKSGGHLVIGACTERGSAARRIAWRMLKSTSGINYGDITSGFRALDRQAIALLSSSAAVIYDYQDVGVLLMCDKAGITVTEIPVEMLHRKNGKSRIFHSWPAVLTYMLTTLLLGLAKRNTTRKASVMRSIDT
jgi:glycosyltransferase involved in cell wall biosynthesis